MSEFTRVGCSVVEKPIDVSLESADRLIEACRRNNVKLCVISQHRFDPAVSELKRAIDACRLGQLNVGTSQTKWYRFAAQKQVPGDVIIRSLRLFV